MQQIDELWDVLNKTSTEKKAILTEANRQQQFSNEVTNLDKWITEIQTALRDKETGSDITTARVLYNKHKKCEKDVETKKKRMIELSANPEEVDEEKLVAEQQIMEERSVLRTILNYDWFPCIMCHRVSLSAGPVNCN